MRPGCPRRAPAWLPTTRTAFYQMAHDRWRTQVFIPLNTTNEGNYQQITMEKISQQGIPICREGHDMYFSGYCKDLDRVKWRCPIKATKAGKSLGCECLCSRSTYGRVVYTHPKDNLRLYPKTPRNSLTWISSSHSSRRDRKTAISFMRCFRLWLSMLKPGINRR